jgi:hypothetical protein
MIRMWGLAGLAMMALWAFCVFDVIATQESMARNLPKPLWLLIVIFVPTLGSIAWLVLGRPENVRFSPGSTDYRVSHRPIGPEDAPDWAPRTGGADDQQARQLREWEDELRRREEDLRRREDRPPEPG